LAIQIQANTTYNFSVIWLDRSRNLVEAVEPKIEIYHFVSGSRVVDISGSSMARREKGIYDFPLFVSTTNYAFNTEYLVVYSARNPTSNTLNYIEDSFQIIIPATNDGLNISTVR
jgi:hypothetical protein